MRNNELREFDTDCVLRFDPLTVLFLRNADDRITRLVSARFAGREVRMYLTRAEIDLLIDEAEANWQPAQEQAA